MPADQERQPPAPEAATESGAGSGQTSAAGRKPRVPSKRTVAREARRRRSESKRTRRRRFYLAGGSIIALALIAGLVLPSVGPLGLPDSAPPPSEQRALAGAEVDIPPGGDAPPTTGAGAAEGASWGIHTERVPDEVIVRNLEEGSIVFNHNLADEADAASLEGFVESLPGYPNCYVIHPYPGLADGGVTLTAWGWADAVDLEDTAAMEAFAADHRNQGPRFIEECGASGSVVSSGTSHDAP